jgi:type VI secretion system protein VasG
MITADTRALLSKTNLHVAHQLEAAAGFTIARTHYEVTLEHLLLKLLEAGTGDVPKILRYFEVDPGAFEAALLATVERFRAGNSSRPVFSPLLLDTLERALLVGAVELDQTAIRSGSLLTAALTTDGGAALRPYLDLLEPIRPDELRRQFPSIVAGSEEDRPAGGRYATPRPGAGTAGEGPVADTALAQFTLDFTGRARAGEIDPVFGREDEIRQMIDILMRRRKNNPILVGEAGVGKTALVEGLALRVAAGEVPKALAGVEIRSLDLGLLQAGAGVKGEFENRLKSVMAEIRESPVPIVTFIDEAHTLIGAGASAGQGDAANLLKPALARGELRTIAATTWSEYKKYFEKDPALARRFQVVKVEEPDEERAFVMLRGIKPKFEAAHGVRVLDSAVEAAVQLSARFLSGRQLPDKAVDLLDTAAARVKIALSSKPPRIEDLERRIQNTEIALAAKRRDVETGSAVDDGELTKLAARIGELRGELEALEERWRAERQAVERLEALRAEVTGAQTAPREAAPEPSGEAAAEETPAEPGGEPGETAEAAGEAPEPTELAAGKDRGEAIREALAAVAAAQGDAAMIPLEVTADVMAAVVSDWTGIPAGKMVRDQARMVLDLEGHLGRRILGQDHALKAVAERVRAAKAGLGNPHTPMGVFLMVGPSGVGKTETGLGLADLLFGGERFLTTVNMSEYMEAHTVSRLIGSPPGYVGYGEGGVLTEGVRQHPYTVVLLDEVEKSHPDVMNLFYQVFDKGVLADGEGREIDFKNTVILMTSNLASDALVEMCAGEVLPEPDELVEALRPQLRERFKPALLARMTIIPYYPLGPEVLRRIVDLKLGQVVRRLAANARIELSYEEALGDWIAERCTVEETGARNIDAILQGQVLPRLSTEILERMAREEPIRSIRLDVDGGEIRYTLV